MLNIQVEKKDNDKKAIISTALIFTALGVLFIPQMLYLGIVAFLIYMLKFSELDNYKLCLLLIPMIRIFDATGVSFVVNILLVLPALITWFKCKKINKYALVHTTILIVMELIHNFIFNNIDNMFSNISAVLPLLFCESLIRGNDKDSQDFSSASRWLALGSIISAIIYLLGHREYFNSIIYSVIDGLRFTAYADDPNYYSVYIVMAIIGLLANPQHKKIDYILITVLVAIGMLTASKMCLIMMIITLLTYISSYLISSVPEKKRFVRRFLAIAIVAVVFLGDKITLLLGNIITRLAGKEANITLSTATTGRSQLAISYFQSWLDDPVAMIFGYGFQYRNSFDIMIHNRNYTSVAHNTYLDIVLSWGALGLVVVGIIVFGLIKASKVTDVKNKGFITIYPYIALSIMLMALSCLSAGMFWFIISFPIVINIGNIEKGSTTDDQKAANRIMLKRGRICGK